MLGDFDVSNILTGQWQSLVFAINIYIFERTMRKAKKARQFYGTFLIINESWSSAAKFSQPRPRPNPEMILRLCKTRSYLQVAGFGSTLGFWLMFLHNSRVGRRFITGMGVFRRYDVILKKGVRRSNWPTDNSTRSGR